MGSALATQSYEPSAAMPPAPKQIGRFEVRSEIGRGSNGVVYAAFDPVLGREVAIKAIPLAADNVVRLLPPLVIESAHVGEAIAALDRTCAALA